MNMYIDPYTAGVAFGAILIILIIICGAIGGK